ncbi:MAG: hypothetical protein ACOCUS_01725 [Polyangiales bacterium]
MIVVTGTKRSGTSLWMQILGAAGLPIFGEAFPRRWGETIRDANPEGFYESFLRRGIYYETNPHPKTGAYIHPSQVRRHAVKVFVPGVIRSDIAFLDRVLVTMRHWREYAASLERLYAMEGKARAAREEHGERERPPRLPPVLEWWNECFCLIRDVATRRYATHFVAYETVLERPRTTVRAVLDWMDASGDAEAAAAVVKPSLRTQTRPEVETDLPLRITRTFDALYEHVCEQRALDERFVAELNQVNEELAPRILRHHREHQRRLIERRAQRAAISDSG